MILSMSTKSKGFDAKWKAFYDFILMIYDHDDLIWSRILDTAHLKLNDLTLILC